MARYIKAVDCAEIISERFNINLDDLVDVFAEVLGEDIEKLHAENERLQKEILKYKEKAAKYKAERDKAAEDFYQYVQGGTELCAFCLHDDECVVPGESMCGATYKAFRWRGLEESKCEK